MNDLDGGASLCVQKMLPSHKTLMKKFFGDLISAHKRTFILLELIHPNTAHTTYSILLQLFALYRWTHFMPQGIILQAKLLSQFLITSQLEFID